MSLILVTDASAKTVEVVNIRQAINVTTAKIFFITSPRQSNCAADFKVVVGDFLKIFRNEIDAINVPIVAFVKDSPSLAQFITKFFSLVITSVDERYVAAVSLIP